MPEPNNSIFELKHQGSWHNVEDHPSSFSGYICGFWFDTWHVIAILEVFERDIVYCQMSNFSAISWIEQVNFCMRL